MAKEQKDIIRRIQGLIALSNSPNEGEASAAAKKAQALLADYNLSMDDVMLHGKKEFVTKKTNVMDVYAYLRGLGMAVAASHFCEYYYGIVRTQSKKKKKNGEHSFYNREDHRFCGLDHNATVAVLMFDYLQVTIFRLAREAAKKRAAETGEKFSWSYVTGFQNGACYRIAQRLRDAVPTVEQVQQAPTGSTLPALLSLHQRTAAEIKEHLKKEVELVTSKPRQTKYDEDGISDGMEAGDTIGLNTQVGSEDRKMLA